MITLPASDTLTYRGHHTITARSTQLDGFLEAPDGTRCALDVISVHDAEIGDADADAGLAAAAAGTVLVLPAEVHGAPTLVVEEPALTPAAIEAALSRLFAAHEREITLTLDL